MGPRSENRGYRGADRLAQQLVAVLQWVHGPRTVVICCFEAWNEVVEYRLQWVHGPRTVVMSGTLPER